MVEEKKDIKEKEEKKIVPVEKDIKVEVIDNSEEEDSLLDFFDEDNFNSFQFRGHFFSDVSLDKRGFFDESLEDVVSDAPRIKSDSDNTDIDYLKKPENDSISYKTVDAFETEDDSLSPEQKELEKQKRIYSSVESSSDRMKSLHESEQKREYFTAEDIKKKHSFIGRQ